MIQWKTTNEINVDRFELQANAANNNWQTIQKISATNSTQLITIYSFNYNHSAETGNKQLRLKMIDKDGTITYSKIISVQCGKDNVLSLYPNPAVDRVTITGTKAGELYRIMGIDGRIGKSGTTIQGNTNIDITNLPAGVYMLLLRRDAIWINAGKLTKQ